MNKTNDKNPIYQRGYPSNTTRRSTPQAHQNHNEANDLHHPINHDVIQPPEPLVYPKIPPNGTASHQDQLQIQHEKVRRIYKHMGTMDEALKNKVMDIV